MEFNLVDVGEPIKVGGVKYNIFWIREFYGWHIEAATGGVVIAAIDMPCDREREVLSSILRLLSRRVRV